MDGSEPRNALRSLIDTVKVGLLSTVGVDGHPRTRWMTAATLPGDREHVYCVSMASSRKVDELRLDEKVSWSFQTPGLDRIVSVEGRAAVLDNPELKAQTLEALGPNLQAFWRVNPDPRKLVVIETYIEKARLYSPMDDSVVTEEASR